jgi:hypothetical protein
MEKSLRRKDLNKEERNPATKHKSERHSLIVNRER